MTRISILPISTEAGATCYVAVAGQMRSQGATIGEAIDALTSQLSEDQTGTLIIVQNQRPDSFFTASQQKRLADLMGRWREARDRGESLPSEEQTELDALVEAELRASADRAAALADELGR